MRAIFVSDRRASAALDKPLKHPIDVGPGKAAGQLSVAEATGSPLAEEVVILLVQSAPVVELADCGNPLLHRATAFEDQGGVAAERQIITGQQSRRS